MTAVVANGQCAVACKTSTMACLGDAGRAGHSQCIPGKRVATAAAVMRALVEAGDDRKPCR